MTWIDLQSGVSAISSSPLMLLAFVLFVAFKTGLIKVGMKGDSDSGTKVKIDALNIRCDNLKSTTEGFTNRLRDVEQNLSDRLRDVEKTVAVLNDRGGRST